jgi:L-alanine-DL-glutamate epimerase-like enolase superfamily enzyme
MKIKSVKASWVHIPIPPERQHTSDFGKTLSFDGTIVRVETECGITGWGEAKSQVGGMAQNQALTTLINDELGPLVTGEDPRDITRLWELMYNGTRGHYAVREGRVFPVLGRRGITISAISGIDCALWTSSANRSGSRCGGSSEAGGARRCRPMPRAAGRGRTRSATS